jgi:hypothetical protein
MAEPRGVGIEKPRDVQILELVDQSVGRLAVATMAVGVRREVPVADDRSVEWHDSVAIEGR